MEAGGREGGSSTQGIKNGGGEGGYLYQLKMLRLEVESEAPSLTALGTLTRVG